MSKFKNLQKYTVEATAECELFDIMNEDGSYPVLIVKPATSKNPEYYNQQMRMAVARKEDALRYNSTKIIDALMLENQRKDDRELFPRTVIVGWKNVIDADGTIVDFNIDDCIDFLDAIPDYIFDKIREFAKNEANFSKAGKHIFTKEEKEETAKK